MRTVYSEGAIPGDLMLVGERPGIDETRQDRPFVGRAGRELWERFEQHHLPSREDWYIANLVKIFSKEPPSFEEVAKWGPMLLDEIRRVKPILIVTAGAHATRWCLGDVDMDKVQGLPHVWPADPRVTILPIYHPAAALRQPELYQDDFHRGVGAIRAWLDDPARPCHIEIPLRVASYDLRTASPDIRQRCRDLTREATVGLDLEGTIASPECLTLGDLHAAWLIGASSRVMAARMLASAKRLIFHYAIRDLRACWALGLHPESRPFEDLMLGAYLLDEPQALKTLAYRTLGYVMEDYVSLITPLDDTCTRDALTRARDRVSDLDHAATARGESLLLAARTTKSKTKLYLAKRKVRRDKAAFAPTRRLLTSLTKLLTKEGQATLRKRWTASTFEAQVTLPPEPTWKDIPAPVGVPYACGDAHTHATVWIKAIRPRLKQEGLLGCYRMDRAVIPFLARMEHVGMQVRAAHLDKLSRDLHLEYVKVCGQLEALLGYPLNPKASEDVADTLFGELGVTPTKLTKSGKHYTTQDKYLEARKKEHAAIPLIIRGRELWKLKSSYTEKLPTMLDGQGRYHPEFGYTRSASGRLTETIILLIPKHTSQEIDGQVVKWGKKIREAFVAGEGNSLVSCDLSQIELRVLAHVSGDAELIKIFKQGRDPHAETAHHLLGAPKRNEDQDESKHRLPSKKLNYGMFMGLSDGGLTDQIRAGGNPEWAKGCPACDYTGTAPAERPDHADECASKVARAEYFKLFRGVRQYIDDRHAEARRFGVVRDMWGRKIYVAGIYSAHRGVVGRFERMAQATPIQAGADGISKRWNARLWAWMQEQPKRHYLEPWTRTHDDTVLECDATRAAAVQRQMLALVPQDLCIPVLAEGKQGHSWGTLT